MIFWFFIDIQCAHLQALWSQNENNSSALLYRISKLEGGEGLNSARVLSNISRVQDNLKNLFNNI